MLVEGLLLTSCILRWSLEHLLIYIEVPVPSQGSSKILVVDFGIVTNFNFLIEIADTEWTTLYLHFYYSNVLFDANQNCNMILIGSHVNFELTSLTLSVEMWACVIIWLCRPLTFHILITSSKNTCPNELKYMEGPLYKLLISAWCINKHGRHRQSLFLISRLLKIFTEYAWLFEPKRGMNQLWKVFYQKLLILYRSINKHGSHRQFLFLIGWFITQSSPLKLSRWTQVLGKGKLFLLH